MSSDPHLEAARQDGPIPGWEPVESISLSLAVYCVNCDQITRSDQALRGGAGRCQVCGSDSTMNLARALFRDGEAVA